MDTHGEFEASKSNPGFGSEDHIPMDTYGDHATRCAKLVLVIVPFLAQKL